MALKNSKVYTKEILTFPLKNVSEDFEAENLNHVKVNMVFVENEKKDKDLMIFSDLEMFEGKEKTLRNLFTFFMFKDTTKATKKFEENLNDVKKNVDSDLKIEQQFKNTFYEEYNLSIYLNVVIMFVKPFEIPRNILLPIIQSKKVTEEKIKKWPILYVTKDENGYYQMVKKATFATRGKLESFLNFNINQLYKDLGNSKIENKMKFTRFLSPPYSKNDWDLKKGVTTLIKEYIGIHAHVKEPRYKQKIKGIDSKTNCIIEEVYENKEIGGDENILDLFSKYFFPKSSKNGMLLLVHVLRQKLEYFKIMTPSTSCDLSTYLAAASVLLKVNICIFNNNHFISLRNIFSAKCHNTNDSHPILGIMKKENKYFIVNKIKMSGRKIICNPAPHSALEELCFKHFKIAHQINREVNYDNIVTEAMVLSKKIKATEIRKSANLLYASTIEDTNNHEKERYQKYCKIINNPEKCVDFFSEHDATDDSIEKNATVNHRTFSRNEYKRPFSAISQNVNNVDSSDSEYESENDIDSDEHSDISFISEQLSILEVESISDMEGDNDFEYGKEFEDESEDEYEFEKESNSEEDMEEYEGTIEIKKNRFVVWHPTKLASDILIKNIPKNTSDIYNKTITNINWKSLIKQCQELDVKTPANYNIFKRTVFKIWEDEIERVNKEKDNMRKRISFDVDGYRHLKDNGSEITGLLSQRHYTEQIIKKADVSAETIDTNVYIFNFQKEITKDNVSTHYYRCKSCKEIEDKLAKAKKRGIQTNDEEASEKSATLIRKYNDGTLIEETPGFNKFHRTNCQPISLLEVLAGQYEIAVKQTVSTGLTNFDSAYETMRFNTKCLATLHRIEYHRIMIKVVRVTLLRDQCQRLNEVKGNNRIEFLDSIMYTMNSENLNNEKLIRYKDDNIPIYEMKDILVENDFIIYGAPLQYIMSAECDIWMADGCHSLLCRREYEQVYTIHGNFKKIDKYDNIRVKFFPLFSVCMKNKSKLLYTEVLEKLFDILHNEYNLRLNIKTFLIDKEMAAYKAFKDCFKKWKYNVSIEFCYYHYTSNLFKKLHEFNLNGYYMGWKKQKSDFYKMFRRYFNLPHLEESKIVDAHKQCALEIKNELDELIKEERASKNSKKVTELLNLQRKSELFAKYIFKNWLSTSENLKLICKYDKDIRTTNPCESFHKVCKLKGCSDTYVVERTLKNLRIIYDNVEIELKRLQENSGYLPNQNLKYRLQNERLDDLRSYYNLETIENCLEYLDEIGESMFTEKATCDEYGNYKIAAVQSVTKEIESCVGNTDVRHGKNVFTSPKKKKTKKNKKNRSDSTPKRSIVDRGLRGLENAGTQCFANCVLQLLFLCSDFLDNLATEDDDNAKMLVKTFTKYKISNKKKYLKLNDNDFYKIPDLKKYVYSGNHECASEFLLNIFTMFQNSCPTTLESIKIKKELSITCKVCKSVSIIENHEMNALNIKINRNSDKKCILDIIKTMLSEEIESIKRTCTVCKIRSIGNVKKETIRKYPKYLFVELTKDIMNKKYSDIGINFLSSKDSFYVSQYFMPNVPYKLKGFAVHQRFSENRGHYMAYVRDQEKWCLLNDAHPIKELEESMLHTEMATILLYEMEY
uniref:ubiquitinyl hydrolase 1 n=1 Tax=Strongyloides papillosus TaxID=174720 RepID=A0A0N5BHW6_STREA